MPNLRVRDIRVDKPSKRVFCVISHPDVASLDASVRSQIRSAVGNSLPQNYRCDVQFANDRFTARSFTALISDFTKKRFPLFAEVKQDKISVKIEDLNASATFFVNKFIKHNMELAAYTEQLQAFFSAYSCYVVHFDVQEDQTATADVNVQNQERLVHLAINRELLKPRRYFDVTDVEKQIGKEISAKPMYISDIRAPMENCVICGTVSEKELRSVKNNSVLKLCKFNLTDGSGATMPCLMFVRFKIEDFETIKQTTGKSDSEVKTISEKQRAANDTRMKKLTFLTDGTEVLVRGKVVFSQFSQRLELQMYDICKCRIRPISLQPTFKSQVPDDYVLVRPVPIGEFRQLSITRLCERPSVLSGTKCVAIFANVTGYNAVKDKIFALCGVKLKDGHLKEKFYTSVLPEIELTDAQMSDAGVTARQLSLSPTLTELIADIFKFLDDCILVGENLSQLLDLLNYYGAPLGFNFANKTVTSASTFRRLFEASTVDARPSYSQLDEVAKALKLDCRTSPDCRDQAMTVARCMSELASLAK